MRLTLTDGPIARKTSHPTTQSPRIPKEDNMQGFLSVWCFNEYNLLLEQPHGAKRPPMLDEFTLCLVTWGMKGKCYSLVIE